MNEIRTIEQARAAVELRIESLATRMGENVAEQRRLFPGVINSPLQPTFNELQAARLELEDLARAMGCNVAAVEARGRDAYRDGVEGLSRAERS